MRGISRRVGAGAAEDPHLTPRQGDVVRLAVAGATARQSARILGLSVRTVQGHLMEARKRVGAANIGQLTAWAVAYGVVPPVSGLPRMASKGSGGNACTRSDRSCSKNNEISEHDPGAGRSIPASGERRQRGRPTVMTTNRVARAREPNAPGFLFRLCLD